ncbi:hypothetical protein ACU615_21495 [Klebsiella aerogenes]
MQSLNDLKINHDSFSSKKFLGDLSRFLYRGAAFKDARWVIRDIHNGILGEPIMERYDFLSKCKEQLEAFLVIGNSMDTVKDKISALCMYIQFMEINNLSFRIVEIRNNYLKYSEFLFVNTSKPNPKLKKETAYGYLHALSSVLSNVLELPRERFLHYMSRVKNVSKIKMGGTLESDKQNLENTFRFGRFLIALVNGITVETILGVIPIKILLPKDIIGMDSFILRFPFCLTVAEKLDVSPEKLTTNQRGNLKTSLIKRLPVDSIEKTNRWPLVNLRVLAELCIFIAQTGMNLAQARLVKRNVFVFNNYGESYKVRVYKKRRQGEVVFEIFKSYKKYLEKYLEFLDYFFPQSDLLFPKLTNGGKAGDGAIINFKALRGVVLSQNVEWISPSVLRNTRVNWLLRRSGDEDISAEISQHTKRILKSRYEQPSQQRAMIEITQFWNSHDPINKRDLKSSIIGSLCNGQPESVSHKPGVVVDPNCIAPSGCLWCKHHRDVDTEDYVWSLFSFRYLKTIEASSMINSGDVPADLVIKRLTEKIDFYRNSNALRKEWVEECELKIMEGRYHPHWSNIISVLGDI